MARESSAQAERTACAWLSRRLYMSKNSLIVLLTLEIRSPHLPMEVPFPFNTGSNNVRAGVKEGPSKDASNNRLLETL